MEDTLFVQTVGFGSFIPEGEKESRDFANIVCADELSDNETKCGIITAKYDIFNKEGNPDLELAAKIKTQVLEAMKKTGSFNPVPLKVVYGYNRKQGKKVLHIAGIK